MEHRRTAQRNKILEVLQSTDTHPTASWVYDRVRQHIPNISLGTIYRNLNVLVTQGRIQKISCGEAEDRFDAATEPHIHYYCTDCGCVSDIHDGVAFGRLSTLVSDIDADVKTYSLICYGKCKHCEKKNKCN
jgi:Fur family peroxide stress response transcriptional regulator